MTPLVTHMHEVSVLSVCWAGRTCVIIIISTATPLTYVYIGLEMPPCQSILESGTKYVLYTSLSSHAVPKPEKLRACFLSDWRPGLPSWSSCLWWRCMHQAGLDCYHGMTGWPPLLQNSASDLQDHVQRASKHRAEAADRPTSYNETFVGWLAGRHGSNHDDDDMPAWRPIIKLEKPGRVEKRNGEYMTGRGRRKVRTSEGKIGAPIFSYIHIHGYAAW